MGRASLPQTPLSATALARVDPLLAPASLDGHIDFATLFGVHGPVEIEVGFGKGRVLLDLAAARPATHFLGIERARPYARLVRYLLLQAGLDNVRLLAHDAADVFHRLIAPGSVAAVNILFPDPWPKHRHWKRRLIQPEFIDDIARAMTVGGALNIASDHAGYWSHISAVLPSCQSLCPSAEFLLGRDRLHQTHFGARLGARGAVFNAGTWLRV